MRPSPLPASLGGAFSVAQARRMGVSTRRLRAADLQSPFTGLRQRAEPEPSRIAGLHALATILPPQSCFSHACAAEVLRLPLPRRLTTGLIDVTVPSDAARIRRAGIVCHRSDRRRMSAGGVVVTTPADTWLDLAGPLTLVELVQIGDVIANRDGLGTNALAEALERLRGVPGRPRAAQALRLVRPGSASPMESAMRVRFHAWGLPEPELNADLVVHGQWLARVDFLWRARRLVAEYYGDVHGASWRADLQRVGLLEDAGYRVVVITSSDLRRPDSLRLHARLRHLLATG